MKGLELARRYYEEACQNLLYEKFGEYADRIAIGLVGQGSECFGYDDEISRDHDFGAGFCMWVTRDDESKIGYELTRFYNSLPTEYMGIKLCRQSAYGVGKYGVSEINDFYANLIGLETPPENWREWLVLPDFALANGTNGEVFVDKLGEFTKYRELLTNGMPKDIKLKKLSAHLALMAQSGQYNYARCYARGELGASQLAINDFVDHASYVIFNLNDRYMPFYKWRFRAMRDLNKFGYRHKDLEFLLMSTNSVDEYKRKLDLVEDICSEIIGELKARQLSNSNNVYLEPHAIEVAQRITNREIKSLHLMIYN